METFIYFMKFCLFCTALGILTMIVIFLQDLYSESKKIREEERSEYEVAYDWLKERVDNYPVTEHNFKYLEEQIVLLSDMDHKNQEKTGVLWTRFAFKYELYLKSA